MIEISDKEYQKLQSRLKELEAAVAERKQAEESLRESKKRLKEAQRLARIGDWEYDVASEKITWSDQTYKLYERDQVLGPPTAGEEASYYSPEQAKELRDYAAKSIETGQEFTYNLTAKLPSGKTVYFFGTMMPIKDASDQVVKLVGSVQDITERKRAEEEIKKSEEFFKGVTENASDVIIIVDRKGIIKYVSPSAERFLGYKQEEIIGRKGFDFIQPVDIPRALIDFAKAITIKDVIIPNSFHLRHKDGSMRIFEGLGKNLFDNPAVAGFVMNAHDITERKRAEDELRKKVGELEIYYKASMGREDKILELKKQIEKLQK